MLSVRHIYHQLRRRPHTIIGSGFHREVDPTALCPTFDYIDYFALRGTDGRYTVSRYDRNAEGALMVPLKHVKKDLTLKRAVTLLIRLEEFIAKRPGWIMDSDSSTFKNGAKHIAQRLHITSSFVEAKADVARSVQPRREKVKSPFRGRHLSQSK